MNLNAACRLYCSKSKSAKKAVRRLMQWDQRKTVKENGLVSGFKGLECYTFRKFYGLKSIGQKGFMNPGEWGDLTDARKRIKVLKNLGYSLAQIARLHKVSRQRISQLIKYKSRRKS